MYFIKSGEVDISDAKGVSLTTLSVREGKEIEREMEGWREGRREGEL